MNTEAFKTAYHEPRCGANYFTRHPLARKFIYSDGVKECAEAGCYWLLDIAGTELVKPVIAAESMGVLHCVVNKGRVRLRLELEDDVPPAWTKRVDYTDLPDGDWVFYLHSDDGQSVTMILPKEY